MIGRYINVIIAPIIIMIIKSFAQLCTHIEKLHEYQNNYLNFTAKISSVIFNVCVWVTVNRLLRSKVDS